MNHWGSGSILAIACIASAAPLAAQKTDVVTLTNGNLITGEIKGLTRGKLEYTTDDFSTIYIKWIKVRGLTSRSYFEVEVETGRKYFGSLPPASDSGMLVVSLEAAADTLEIARVVSITPITARFLRRFRGNLNAGFNYAKANENVSFSASGDVKYRVSSFETGLSFSSYFQDQQNAPATSRNSVTITSEVFPAPRWSLGGQVQLQQNQELGLALRAILGAGGFRALVQTNTASFRTGAGLFLTRERSYGADSVIVGLEAGLMGRFDVFRFGTPKLDVTTALQILPSLTEGGRIRAEFNSSVRYEVVRDFTVGLNLDDSYDNRPGGTTTVTNDIVASFTLGWTF